ncbi:MAG: hypothetical protein WBP45_08665 [Daejeonella sp.]
MKSILLSAKMLNKAEQKSINGGALPGNCEYACKKTGEATSVSGCGAKACGGCVKVCN